MRRSFFVLPLLVSILTIGLIACSQDSNRIDSEYLPTDVNRVAIAPISTQNVEKTKIPAIAEEGSEPAEIEIVFPTAIVQPVSAWRSPPYPVPWSLKPEDHFYFGRPIPTGARNWPNPQFRYGSTYFGEETTHTGVDLGAARGTDVVAAGDGEVVWVGYGLYRGIEDPTDPYGLSIAIRHDFGHQGQQLFTVYAHLASANVWRGQHVALNEKIGTVGDTGHASGAHLHFEIRSDENRFFSTRNPELWMVPSEGTGVLAGQVLSTRGLELAEQLIQIRNLETGQRWEVWTYAIGTVHPDDALNENFAIGDLPAGGYEVQINFVGKSYLEHLYLYPGQTNIVYFRGRQGFQDEPTRIADTLEQPPY